MASSFLSVPSNAPADPPPPPLPLKSVTCALRILHALGAGALDRALESPAFGLRLNYYPAPGESARAPSATPGADAPGESAEQAAAGETGPRCSIFCAHGNMTRAGGRARKIIVGAFPSRSCSDFSSSGGSHRGAPGQQDARARGHGPFHPAPGPRRGRATGALWAAGGGRLCVGLGVGPASHRCKQQPPLQHGLFWTPAASGFAC